MKTLKLLPFLFFCMFQSIQIHAASLNYINTSNTNTQFGLGTFADLQNLDWLTFEETKNKTRTEIEGGYNNLLNDGWRYATRLETATLLTSVSPGPGIWGIYAGTDWFRSIFDSTASIGIHQFFYGSTNECSSSTNKSCLGGYLSIFSTSLFSDQYGRSGATSMYNIISNDEANLSSLLVRNSNISSVPLPAAVYLFGAPLLGLLGISRHNSQLKKQDI